MGKFTITPEQKEELKSSDSTTPIPLPGADGQGKGTYHNPVTGQEIRSLLDPWHLMKRLRQGWQVGPASPELREKWKVREAELRAEDDAMEQKHAISDEHRVAEKARFDEAVAVAAEATALAILKKLGVDLPDKSGVEEAAPTPAPEGEPEGTQLPLFVPEDAPSKSDTKLVVSHASRPALHLVDSRKGT